MITWEPDRLPDQLLPPNVEPVITLEELLKSDAEQYARLYYQRSGRYLGAGPVRDPYFYVRKFLNGRPLPWERE
jgi:hypothetical protein